PDSKCGDHSGICMYSHARQASSSTGGHAEKIHKRPLRRSHVGVHEDANRFAAAQRTQQATRKVLLGKCAVAMNPAVTVHHGVDVRIIQRPYHNIQWMALQRVKERSNFPSAKMAGQKYYALASRISLSKVFKAVIYSNPGDIHFFVTREQAKFSQLPSQVSVDLAQDLLFLLAALCRKSNVQVAQAYLSEPRMKQVNQQAHGHTESARQWPRKQANTFCQQPNGQIFKPMSH